METKGWIYQETRTIRIYTSVNEYLHIHQFQQALVSEGHDAFENNDVGSVNSLLLLLPRVRVEVVNRNGHLLSLL